MSGEQIGRDLPRRDAEDKLRGRTRYAIDRAEAGMLHGALARADVAAGRITRIDASAALAMPGVHAVVTEADAPGLYGVGIADHPLLAREHVRFHGEPVAAVAAETLELARAAAPRRSSSRPSRSTAHLTMAEALAPGARDLHPDWEGYEEIVAGGLRAGNVAWEATVVRGDTDEAFARADVTVVESEFAVGRQNQASLRAARRHRALRGRPLRRRDLHAVPVDGAQRHRAPARVRRQRGPRRRPVPPSAAASA